MSKMAKIVFELDRDPEEESFPPVSAEILNAKILDDDEGVFMIDNTPFFVEGIALDDRVTATQMPGTAGKYRFKEVTSQSGAKSLSIIFMDDDDDKEAVIKALKERGCHCEYGEFGALHMLAVSVPTTCDYDEISAFLVGLEAREVISFAELAI